MVLIKCPNCGKVKSKLPSQVAKNWLACSRPCQYALMRKHPRVKVTCKTCGIKVERSWHDVRGKRGKYCSRDCFYNDPEKKSREISCFNCGKIIKKQRSNLKINKNSYCSKVCAGLHRTLTTKLEVSCIRCGKIFTTTKKKVENGKSKYCSKLCHYLQVDKCKHCGSVEKVRDVSGLCKNCHRQNYEYGLKYKTNLSRVSKDMANGCGICGSKEKLLVDHDHLTGRYRGTLCVFCNTILGYARDNPQILINASKYLSSKEQQ